MNFPKLASLKTFDQFQQRLEQLGEQIPVDRQLERGAEAPLAQPIRCSAGEIGNRFAILPMEGWDGTGAGCPTELTCRRWRRFGASGAKLIWGGEAVAVRNDGRANPRQLLLNHASQSPIAGLRELLVDAHQHRFGRVNDLLVGLQLTHSGRFARPHVDDRLESRLIYRHPFLDGLFHLDETNSAVFSDDDLQRLIDDFIGAAVLAEKIGFDFVDIKHCHGYLGHELLSAYDRPGLFGGSFENRTRFLRETVQGIRAATNNMQMGVRLSVFDFCPFTAAADQPGIPQAGGPYAHAFGGDGSGTGVDLSEPKRFLQQLEDLQIDLICTTAGSPYYNPHIQRPALYPPSDGYLPPEDPLLGVIRQIRATAELKKAFPRLLVVGSGYSYLQEWLPHVAQAVVRGGWADSVGIGRMALAYPQLPADVLNAIPLDRKRICRTFSDCTTAPRHGMVSGCFPLDPHYQSLPERQRLVELKKTALPRKDR